MRYINNYGCHFNKKLYEWAASQMYAKKNGKKEKYKPYHKDEVDDMLEKYGIEVDRNKLYDACYVAFMCKNDFFRKICCRWGALGYVC